MARGLRGERREGRAMRQGGGPGSVTLPCRCGAPTRAAGHPRLGALVLRHGADPRPLALYDPALVARLAAADPGVLRAPAIRSWLRRYHFEP
jgi:hypothetical protein